MQDHEYEPKRAPVASILSRQLGRARRAILQLMRLKPITHDRPLWIPEELIFAVLTVVNAGHLRRSIEVSDKPKCVHTLRACGDLQNIVDTLRQLRSRNRKGLKACQEEFDIVLQVLTISHENLGN